jgi:prolyl-tRNA synthetase
MVLADTGEESIVYAEGGTYAANVERAEVAPPLQGSSEAPRPLRKVQTPGAKSVEEVTAFLKLRPAQLIKTLLYQTPHGLVAVLVRGDHEVNEIKVKKLLGVTALELADPAKVAAATGAPAGFAGPIGLTLRLIADHAVKTLRNVVVGANEADTHYVDANWDRDFTVEQFADLRNAQAGDPSPKGDGSLRMARGIEVGHVFMLGTKYSQAMGAMFLDPEGKECQAVMGCYGIGVSRIAAAAIEQHHDAKGIHWPAPIAPFHVHLLPLSQSAAGSATAHTLYETLSQAGIEVLWDDRDERAGVKFNDADLIGAPYQLVIGEKGLAQGTIELKDRKTGTVKKMAPGDVLSQAREHLGL